MNKSGLCSITFRDLSVEEVVEVAKAANLDGIEWGSDVHVLPNDLKTAKKVRKLCEKNNLEITSYGSYYRVGIENEYSFEAVLASAIELNAKDIRVWAGRKGSFDADSDYFESVVNDSIRIANLAAEAGIRISYEYHSKTLTDTVKSALALLKAVNHPNVKIYWQPKVNGEVSERINNINQLLPYITNVHIFHWDNIDRLLLSEGKDEWIKYIYALNKKSLDKNRYYLLEFTKDDSIENFYQDAKALNELLAYFNH